MTWSTKELADLAGTTVNTIRHYHRLDLLKEPERRFNGYKQYGVPDLVRLLRIRRLVELGLPLSGILDLDLGYGGSPEALRQVDVDHAAAIERLERARLDIAAILRENAPVDAPPGFEAVASGLSEADRSILHLYAQVYDRDILDDLRRMMEEEDPVRTDLSSLPPDADEATVQNLAEKYAPIIAQHLRDYPWFRDPMAYASKNKAVTRETFVEVMNELYNPAQLEVLRRARSLAHEMPYGDVTAGVGQSW